MKYILTSIIIIFFIKLNAQEQNKVEYVHTLEGINLVSVESIFDVIIKAHEKDELLIVTNDLDNNPKKAKGLKAVYYKGEDNTGVGCNVSKNSSELVVRSLRNYKVIEVYLPKKMALSVNITGVGKINISGFASEIEASNKNGDVSIEKVTGPITASTNSGNVEISINELGNSNPISISSLTSDIDVSLPERTNANVKLVTETGEIYTNFSIVVDDKDKNGLDRTRRGLNAVGKINNGGATITLRSVSGSIYLRKYQ